MNHASTPNGEKLIVLTEAEYRALTEDATDIALANAARAADAGAPVLDTETMKAVLAGTTHPLTAWRKAAGLSQAALAERSGTRAATINEIEAGKVDPRLSTMRAIAVALRVEIDDITA